MKILPLKSDDLGRSGGVHRCENLSNCILHIAYCMDIGYWILDIGAVEYWSRCVDSLLRFRWVYPSVEFTLGESKERFHVIYSVFGSIFVLLENLWSALQWWSCSTMPARKKAAHRRWVFRKQLSIEKPVFGFRFSENSFQKGWDLRTSIETAAFSIETSTKSGHFNRNS